MNLYHCVLLVILQFQMVTFAETNVTGEIDGQKTNVMKEKDALSYYGDYDWDQLPLSTELVIPGGKNWTIPPQRDCSPSQKSVVRNREDGSNVTFSCRICHGSSIGPDKEKREQALLKKYGVATSDNGTWVGREPIEFKGTYKLQNLSDLSKVGLSMGVEGSVEPLFYFQGKEGPMTLDCDTNLKQNARFAAKDFLTALKHIGIGLQFHQPQKGELNPPNGPAGVTF